MKWFTVSISDLVRALDSQSAVAIFLTNLKRQTAQSIVDGYEVEVEEDDLNEDGDE